jgi:hypothetical protein
MRTRATTLYPFVPSGPDFAAARAFLAELGFEAEWEHDGLVPMRFGGARFLLQRIDVPEWQKNQMIVFEVEDLEAYWSELDAKQLPSRFPTARLRAPTDFAWGRELHIVDPGGVCWHVRQRKPA